MDEIYDDWDDRIYQAYNGDYYKFENGRCKIIERPKNMKFDPKDFPEGLSILRGLIHKTSQEINTVEINIQQMYNNQNYDDDTKAFIGLCAKQLYLLPLLHKRQQLKRKLSMYQESQPQSTLNIDKAKQVPIQDTFTPEKARQTSTRISCLCPLHLEDTPSFVIYKKTNTYYCFGCHAKGDVINFVMTLYRKTFKDAVKYLEKL